jgi:hypothetical protein
VIADRTGQDERDLEILARGRKQPENGQEQQARPREKESGSKKGVQLVASAPFMPSFFRHAIREAPFS